jgi:GNAT superfamily N-acetyltransferase
VQAQVTITYLEMQSTADWRVIPHPPHDDLRIALVPKPTPDLNRFFYTAVGGDWFWYEKLSWTYADWMRYLDRAELRTYILTVAGIPAGYFELEKQADQSVQIAYLGLLREFIGQRLGSWMLNEAIRQSWEWDAKRVWVHTCTLDHPQALSAYMARGFQPFQTKTKMVELTDKETYGVSANSHS